MPAVSRPVVVRPLFPCEEQVAEERGIGQSRATGRRWWVLLCCGELYLAALCPFLATYLYSCGAGRGVGVHSGYGGLWRGLCRSSPAGMARVMAQLGVVGACLYLLDYYWRSPIFWITCLALLYLSESHHWLHLRVCAALVGHALWWQRGQAGPCWLWSVRHPHILGAKGSAPAGTAIRRSEQIDSMSNACRSWRRAWGVSY